MVPINFHHNVAGRTAGRRYHKGDIRLAAGGASGSENYPERSTYGGDYLPGAFGSGVSLDSGLMEGTSCPEPLERSVLNTLLVARPMEGSTEMKPPEHSALALQLDDGHLNWESLARPMVDVALDRRHMKGLAVPLPVESLGLTMAPSSEDMEPLSVSRPLEGPCITL